MDLKIYHNPRCRKSREALAYLNDQKMSVEVINYLQNPLEEEELKNVLAQLQIPALDLIRKNEAIWKTDFKGKDWEEEALIKAMLEHPKLMERPIISNGKSAVIARPIEKLHSFLK